MSDASHSQRQTSDDLFADTGEESKRRSTFQPRESMRRALSSAFSTVVQLENLLLAPSFSNKSLDGLADDHDNEDEDDLFDNEMADEMQRLEESEAALRSHFEGLEGMLDGNENKEEVGSAHFWSSLKADIGNLFRSVKGLFAKIETKRQTECWCKDLQPNEMISGMIDIGEVYFSRGHFDDALKAWNQALTVQRTCLGGRHPDVAKTLNLIGVALSQMGDPFTYTALNAYEESLKIRQEVLGPGHQDTANTAHNMWVLLHNVRERQKDEIKGEQGEKEVPKYKGLPLKSERSPCPEITKTDQQ